MSVSDEKALVERLTREANVMTFIRIGSYTCNKTGELRTSYRVQNMENVIKYLIKEVRKYDNNKRFIDQLKLDSVPEY